MGAITYTTKLGLEFGTGYGPSGKWVMGYFRDLRVGFVWSVGRPVNCGGINRLAHVWVSENYAN